MTAASTSGVSVVTEGEARRVRAITRTKNAQAIRAGNSNALRHGIYANVTVREDVRDEAALLYGRAHWLDATRDGLLVEATSRLLVRLRLLDQHLDGHWARAVRDGAEPSASLTSMYVRLEGQLLRNLEQLGLTPRSAADLGLAHLDGTQRARKLAEDGLARFRPGAVA